jgi:DNA-binding transcriptional regulator YhcF (GntR family)
MRYLAKGINVSCRTIEDKAYILLEDKDEFYCLNESGSFIWNEIDGTKTDQQIVDLTIAEYDGTVDEITKFVLEFISDLFTRGMIEVSNEPFEGVMQSV